MARKQRTINGRSSEVATAPAQIPAANTIDASSGNFYSPELSTDFLEMPQSLAEQSLSTLRSVRRINPTYDMSDPDLATTVDSVE